MSTAPGPSHFKWVGELSGERLCDECHGQYATDKWEVGLALRGLCDVCARKIGGAHYFKPNVVSNASAPDGLSNDVQTTYSRTTTAESAHDFGSCRIDDLFDDPLDHSIRSDKEFPTRAKEYLEVLGRIQDDIGMKTWELSNMARCFYRCQGHTYKCKNDHLTTHYRRDRNERKCPRCNRAYRFRMADEMVELAKAFDCKFFMRFVYTVPKEDRDMVLPDLLKKVDQRLRSLFDADILGYWAIPHEFSSHYPPRRNPHVEIWMLPIAFKRTWYEREVKEWDDIESDKTTTVQGSKFRAVRIDEVIRYEKWMLSDEKVEDLKDQIDKLQAPWIHEVSDFTKQVTKDQVSVIRDRIEAHNQLSEFRKSWALEFPDCETEVNVFYNYVNLKKAQYHTIPYALRPPFNPEYVVVFNEDDKIVYETDKKTHETVELSLDEVVEIFRYDYYNTRTHRIHRMGFLANNVWRHYYRTFTGEEPPPLKKEGEEEPDVVCGECPAPITTYWSNDLIHRDWITDVLAQKGVEENILPSVTDWFAFIRKLRDSLLGHTKSTNTQGSLSTSTTVD